MKRFTIHGWVNQEMQTAETMPIEVHHFKAENRVDAVVAAIQAFYPTFIICGAEEEKEDIA